MIISLLLSSFLHTAQAVPLQITQQGRILDTNGASLTGTHNLTFRIYDSATGGSLLWSEPITVSFNNGYYATVLGADEQNNALDSNTLSLYPLYLELQVDNNTPMATRQAINSAPYAQMAGNAEVAASVDGGVVNASEVQINSTQVIDGSGNWVGQPITIDWSNIDPTTIPSYLADGDDNTQLSETQVETYITNGAIDLATNSQVGGSDIVTAGSFNSYLANDIADGDDDTLAGLGCSVGEIAGWDGNTWVCVSDNTLTVSDITMILANNAVDLNASTTIGGLDIVTSIDDSDTLANLSCVNDGEIARYDLALGEWYCDADYVLDEATVESYITNGALDLHASTTIGGSPILTTITDSDTLAALGCSDGQVAKYNTNSNSWSCAVDIDTDTQLSETQVESYITNGALDLHASTTIGGSNIMTEPVGCTNGQIMVYNLATASWACGTDTDTTLSATEVQAMVEAIAGLALQAGTTVGGSPVLTEASAIGVSQLDGTGGSAGQVLTTDGASVSWGDASACVVSNSYTTFPSQIILECGTQTYRLEGSEYIYTDYVIGSDVGCGIIQNGTIICWGNQNASWGMINPPVGSYVSLESSQQQTGDGNLCGIDENGNIECWGRTQYIGTSHAGDFVDLALSSQTLCALDNQQTVQCWGTYTNVPSFNFIEVTGSFNTLCGITTLGTVKCWGQNPNGGVSVPNNSFSNISSGYGYTCGISGGYLRCWGNPSYSAILNPPGGSDYVQVSSATNHACALKQDGTVVCWGASNSSNLDSPIGTFASIYVNEYSSCGRRSSGRVECWGDDNHGQVSTVP